MQFNMWLIPVGPILQHNTAPAHAGFVRGLASDNVFAEYLSCAPPSAKALGGSLLQADAVRSFLEGSDEQSSYTPGFGQ
jgi:hypothetical protein